MVATIVGVLVFVLGIAMVIVVVVVVVVIACVYLYVSSIVRLPTLAARATSAHTDTAQDSVERMIMILLPYCYC